MRATPRDERLADPTWYRILYSLAALELQAAEPDVRFNPDSTSAADVLVRKSAAPAEVPFEQAEGDARNLVALTAAVLDRMGWDFVGRQPPRYRSWFRRILAKLGHDWRRLRRKIPRRTFVGDWRLARFLSRSVEPAAVVLLCAARAELGRPVTIDDKRQTLPPLKRKDARMDGDWVARYLTELVVEQPLRAWPVRLLGWMGASRFRKAKRPELRVEYNLACLFSRMAGRRLQDGDTRDRDLKRSAQYLESCLSRASAAPRGETIRRARSDPGLAALRQLSESRFTSIVGEEEANAQPAPGHEPPRGETHQEA